MGHKRRRDSRVGAVAAEPSVRQGAADTCYIRPQGRGAQGHHPARLQMLLLPLGTQGGEQGHYFTKTPRRLPLPGPDRQIKGVGGGHGAKGDESGGRDRHTAAHLLDTDQQSVSPARGR